MEKIEKEPWHAVLSLFQQKQANAFRLLEEKGAVQVELKRVQAKLSAATQREEASAEKCTDLQAVVEDLTEKVGDVVRTVTARD